MLAAVLATIGDLDPDARDYCMAELKEVLTPQQYELWCRDGHDGVPLGAAVANRMIGAAGQTFLQGFAEQTGADVSSAADTSVMRSSDLRTTGFLNRLDALQASLITIGDVTTDGHSVHLAYSHLLFLSTFCFLAVTPFGLFPNMGWYTVLGVATVYGTIVGLLVLGLDLLYPLSGYVRIHTYVLLEEHTKLWPQGFEPIAQRELLGEATPQHVASV